MISGFFSCRWLVFIVISVLLQDSGDIERGLEGVEGVKQTPVDVMVSRSWFFSCCGLVFYCNFGVFTEFW